MLDRGGRYTIMDDAKSESAESKQRQRDKAYEEGWDECEAAGLGGPTRAEIMQEDV